MMMSEIDRSFFSTYSKPEWKQYREDLTINSIEKPKTQLISLRKFYFSFKKIIAFRETLDAMLLSRALSWN